MRAHSVLLWLLLWTALRAQPPLTVREAVALRSPVEAAISPDASSIVLTVREADFAARRFVSHLWLVPAKGDESRQLTAGDGCDWAPSWSPDGEFVAFLSDRSLGPGARPERMVRLWLIPVSGGEALCVSGTAEVLGYRWARTERRLFFVTRQTPETREADPQIYHTKGVPDELWVVHPPDGPAWRVATLGARVDDFDVSPDGEWAAFSTRADTSGYEFVPTVRLVNLVTGKIRKIAPEGTVLSVPRFSPDGHSLACLTTTRPEIVCGQGELAMVHLGSGRVTQLTRRLDLAVSEPVWLPDGKSVCVAVAAGTNTYFYQIHVGERRISDLVRAAGVARSFGVAADGQTYAYLHEDARTLPELFLRAKGKEKKLTDFSAQLAQFTLGSQEVIRYQNEGHQLGMVVVYPVGYVPGIRCPVLLFVHDGPYDRFVNTFQQRLLFQVFANRGYLVAAPNQRGSAGYTEDFARASCLDIGGGDYRDLMAAVMYLDDIGLGDFERMGILGLGYGGYMVNWAVTQTDRFRAAVSLSGIFNLMCTSGGPEREAWQRTYLGAPYWLDSKPYTERSPVFYARFIETPVLLLHGEHDPIVEVQAVKEAARALTSLGKTVQLVIYPGEGHHLDSDPQHVVDWLERTLRWFDHYVVSAPRSAEGQRDEP